ncbi:helix-turn-helix domain-containing protein [Mycoplasmatota bacterium]|nr:helix-turn-helix domain-containing protein [Mycoplasmatota bacterium]
MNEVLTVKEIVEYLRCDIMTVYKLIHEGRIKTVNIGTEKKPKYRILKEWFESFLNGTTE